MIPGGECPHWVIYYIPLKGDKMKTIAIKTFEAILTGVKFAAGCIWTSMKAIYNLAKANVDEAILAALAGGATMLFGFTISQATTIGGCVLGVRLGVKALNALNDILKPHMESIKNVINIANFKFDLAAA